MCMSCGCGRPDESHGNEDHITRESLQRAADAGAISLQEAAENIATWAGPFMGTAWLRGRAAAPIEGGSR